MTALTFKLSSCTATTLTHQFQQTWTEAKIATGQNVALAIESTGEFHAGKINQMLDALVKVVLPHYKQVTTLTLMNFTYGEFSTVSLSLAQNQSPKTDAPLNHIKTLVIHPLVPLPVTEELKTETRGGKHYLDLHKKQAEEIGKNLQGTGLKKLVVKNQPQTPIQTSLMNSLILNLDILEDTAIKVVIETPKEEPLKIEGLPELSLAALAEEQPTVTQPFVPTLPALAAKQPSIMPPLLSPTVPSKRKRKLSPEEDHEQVAEGPDKKKVRTEEKATAPIPNI